MFQRAANVRVPVTREITFPAPVKGWVQSGNVTTAGPDQAEVLDNFFPSSQSARLRGGSQVYADIGTAVVRMMVYSESADKLFAASAGGIFDADRISGGGDVFADVVTTSGDWSAQQISTAAGDFLVAVNGTDLAQLYNGASWAPISGAAQNDLAFDGQTAAFAVGETVTGGTSGATATIVGISMTATDAGVLRLGAVAGGPFQNDEPITSATGAALANGANAAGSAVTITGVSTSDLTQVWLHQSRLWFVEKGSLSAWYMPAASIGGAATEFDMGAVFKRGGRLMFGASWSLDTGAGLDDVCIFITSNGEIAVYQGTDPSSAATWSLSGVYDIARPLNKHAHFKAGGDLAILTEDGIIPVSEALRKDRAALQAVAVTYPIEDAWKDAISNRTTEFPITPTLWQSQAMLMIGVPGSDGVAYVANARTGAWCRYIGWDVRCGAVAGDRLYFGTNDGRVMRGQIGGTDDGVAYVARYVPKFSELGGQALKMANHAGLTFRAEANPDFAMAAFADYEIGTYPNAPALLDSAADVWGTAIWGTFIWGGSDDTRTFTRWKTVRASGFSIAPALVVNVNQGSTPAFEILATRLRFETARGF